MSDKVKRRDFIRKFSAGLLLTGFALKAASFPGSYVPATVPKRKKRIYDPRPDVALIRGSDRKTNMYEALKLIETDIKSSIGDRQVVIKPNFTRVRKEDWLASTHVDNIEAVLEFLKPFYKKKVIIAEGTGTADPVEVALKNYDYQRLKDQYNVEFFDLMKDDHSPVNIIDGNIQPLAISASDLMLSPDIYLISASVMKTHSLAVVTLGLKNVLMATPMNFGNGNNDRGKMHNDPVAKDPRYFNYNLFLMSQRVFPDLALIDGFIGMEGNGPLFGDPVEAGVAIASTDCIAADRIGTEVMGHDFNDVGYLNHCAQAKMGEGDLTKINVLGEKIIDCKKNFRPADDLDKISRWK